MSKFIRFTNLLVIVTMLFGNLGGVFISNVQANHLQNVEYSTNAISSNTLDVQAGNAINPASGHNLSQSIAVTDTQKYQGEKQFTPNELAQDAPNGNRVAYVVASDAGMRDAHIVVEEFDDVKKIVLAQSDDTSWVSNPLWSPDGQYVAYLRIVERQTDIYSVDTVAQLWVADAKTGEIVQSIQDDSFMPAIGFAGQTNSFYWTSQNQIEYINELTQARYKLNITTGAVTQISAGQTRSSMRVNDISILPVPFFSQKGDVPWANDQLGSCSLTVGQAGCAITSVAMLIDYYYANQPENCGNDNQSDCFTDPGGFNAWLRNSGGYAQGCLIRWAVAPGIADGRMWFVGQKWGNLTQLEGDIDAELQQGYPVVVQVYNSQKGTHFVPIIGKVNGEYIINDTWTGGEHQPFGAYADTLVKMVIYRGNRASNEPPVASPDLRIERLEVNQAVQNANADVTLVAHKRTVVRAYVELDGPSYLSNVKAELHISKDGAPVSGSPQSATTYVSRTKGGEFRFFAPSILENPDSGNYTFEVVLDPDNAIDETNENNNRQEITRDFQKRNGFKLLGESVQVDGILPDHNRVTSAPSFIRKTFPVPNNGIDYHYLGAYDYWVDIDPWGGGAAPQLTLTRLEADRVWHNLWNDPDADYIAGFFPHDGSSGRITLGYMIPGLGQGVVIRDFQGYINSTVAHELGHHYGLGIPTEEYDMPDSSAPKAGPWAFDVLDRNIVSATHSNFMNNEPESLSWVSVDSYERILGQLTTRSALRASSGAGDYLIINGLVISDTNVQLEPIYQVYGDITSPSPDVGSWRIEFVNAGSVVSTHHFEPSSQVIIEPIGPTDLQEKPFSLVIPEPASGFDLLRFVYEGQSQHELPITTYSPVVTLTTPGGGEIWDEIQTIVWQADDDDGDALHYSVLYSPDGAKWLPLATDLSETSFAWDTTGQSGGDNAYIRVMATDGFNTSMSENSAPFSVVNKAPIATIVSPDDGAQFITGMDVPLNGAGTDLEDGRLTGSDLIWASDVQGTFGTDEYVVISSLISGIHHITLTATDSNGLSSSDTITVEILVDSDGDWMPDVWENQYTCTNSQVDDAGEDPDDDNLVNVDEYNIGTNPCNPDTDGDGILDGAEVLAGSDPLDPYSVPPGEDVIPPVTYAAICCKASGNDNWYLDDIEAKLTAIDSKTEIAKAEYKLNAADWLTYTTPITLTTEGRHTLQYRSIDNAGNIEDTHTRHINIDKTPPTITADLTPPAPNEGQSAFTTDVALTLNGDDPGDDAIKSGLDALQYRLNKGAWTDYTEPVLISQNGANIIEYRAVDLAGNITTGVPLNVEINKTRYTLIPPAPAQRNVLAATEAIVNAIEDERRPLWLAQPMTTGGGTAWFPGGGSGQLPENVYPVGSIIIAGDVGGNFDKTVITQPLSVSTAEIFYPGSVALFQSGSQDNAASWEWTRFNRLFQNWLWDDYADTLDESALSSDLPGYDLLLLPAGVTDDVRQRFTDSGAATALQNYVAQGGWVYAQADAGQLLELAALLTDTVQMGDYSEAATTLNVLERELPLTTGWLTPTIERLDDSPAFNVDAETIVVATYSDNGEPAVILKRIGSGGVILAGWHPTLNTDTFDVVIGAIYTALAQPLDLDVSVSHAFSGNIAHDIAPAFEKDFEINIENTLRYYGLADMTDAVYTETIAAGFELVGDPIASAGVVTVAENQLIWQLDSVESGEYTLNYSVKTGNDTVLQEGLATVSRATLDYRLGDAQKSAPRPDAIVRAELPPQLTHLSQSEYDNTYPFAADGYPRHYREILENKSSTAAHNVLITRTVPLLAFVQDANDQSHFPRTLNDDRSVLMLNSISGYGNPDYLRPQGASSDNWRYDLNDWDCQTKVRIPNPNGENLTYPPEFADFFIEELPNGDLLVPAINLIYEVDTVLPYELKEYDIRFKGRTDELWNRGLSFASDPITGTMVAEGNGGSVYVIAGEHFAAWQDALGSGSLNPPQSAVPNALTYNDVWGRDQRITDTLYADHFDIVPYSHLFSDTHNADLVTTVGLYDPQGNLLLDYPTYLTASLQIRTAFRSNNHALSSDQAVVQHWLSRGFITPIDFTGWTASNPSFTLTDDAFPPNSPFRVLSFQGDIAADEINILTLNAQVNPSRNDTYEGALLFDGGAYLTNRSFPGGPSLYDRTYAPAYIEQGNRAHLELQQYLTPVDVGLRGAKAYGILHLQDSNEPHAFNPETYLDGTPGGDKTARVQVGGTLAEEIKYPVVAPGGDTVIFLHLINGTADDWTGVTISHTGDAPVTLTPIFVDETPPNIFDGPYMHAETIPGISRGVYAWRVDVAPEAAAGVYAIDFTLSGDNVPSTADFPLPAALIGVSGGDLSYTMGQATLSDFNNLIAPYVKARAAYEFSATLFEQLKEVVVQDMNVDDTPNTDAFYQTLTISQTEIPTVATTLPGSAQFPGQRIDYTLPAKWQTMPAGVGETEFYIFTGYNIDPLERGQHDLSYSASTTQVDNHNIKTNVEGNGTRFTAHGAYLVATYTVRAAEASAGRATQNIQPANLDSEVTIWVSNEGDDTAKNPIITATLAPSVTLLSANPAPTSIEGNVLTWELTATIVPAYDETFDLSLHLPAGIAEPINVARASANVTGYTYPAIERVDSTYVDPYGGRTLVNDQLADELQIRYDTKSSAYSIYLPVILKNYTPPTPDLAVTGLSITPAAPNTSDAVTVTVVIANQGERDIASGETFWLDIYLDPSSPPTTAGQRWADLSEYGIGFEISDGLPVGEEKTLTFNAPIDGPYSQWPGFIPTPGEHTLYAYVDSWNGAGDLDGLFSEANEADNAASIRFNATGSSWTVELTQETLSLRPIRR